jgi:hypothetical protein
MSIREERRCEPRTELYRIWTVSVESNLFGHRRAQMLDYSASGMRLLLDGGSAFRPGEQLEIHYPGTGLSYLTAVAWCRQDGRQVMVGARLLHAVSSGRQAS